MNNYKYNKTKNIQKDNYNIRNKNNIMLKK